MQVVAVDHCKEGMEVAKSIVNKYGLTLVEANVRLTPQLIERLKERNVKVIYIKDKPKKGRLIKQKEKSIKETFLMFISISFAAIIGLKFIYPPEHQIPVAYLLEYRLLSLILFIAIIFQQTIILLKRQPIGSTFFQQITSFVFSFNLLTLAVMYFQNSVLKDPHWIYFYLLIFIEIVIVLVSFAVWNKPSPETNTSSTSIKENSPIGEP